MPTESLVCASGPRPETMIMAESGTAPSSGRTIPPSKKKQNIYIILTLLAFKLLTKYLIKLSESVTQAQ